jgi:predicted thioesterase
MPTDVSYLSQPLPPGSRSEWDYPVAGTQSTDHIPGRPGVLRTPDLVGLLEETAAKMVRPRLAPGAASVGVRVDIHHTGAAYVDETVHVTAVLSRNEGRRLFFDVHAFVDERPVGHGEIGFALVRYVPAEAG